MRSFGLAALSLVLLGFGGAPAFAETQSFNRELAFQRLELQAELESFYETQAAKAEGLTQEERVALYREADAELTRMILSSPLHSGLNLRKGMNELEEARDWLAYRLGLDEVPASDATLLVLR